MERESCLDFAPIRVYLCTSVCVPSTRNSPSPFLAFLPLPPSPPSPPLSSLHSYQPLFPLLTICVRGHIPLLLVRLHCPCYLLSRRKRTPILRREKMEFWERLHQGSKKVVTRWCSGCFSAVTGKIVVATLVVHKSGAYSPSSSSSLLDPPSGTL